MDTSRIVLERIEGVQLKHYIRDMADDGDTTRLRTPEGTMQLVQARRRGDAAAIARSWPFRAGSTDGETIDGGEGTGSCRGDDAAGDG